MAETTGFHINSGNSVAGVPDAVDIQLRIYNRDITDDTIVASIPLQLALGQFVVSVPSALTSVWPNEIRAEIRVEYNGTVITKKIQADQAYNYLKRTSSAADLSPPINVTPNVLSTTSIELQFDPPVDPIGITGYEIYLDNVSVIITNSTSYTHTGLTAGTQYLLGVQSVGDNDTASSRVTVSATTNTVAAANGISNLRVEEVTQTQAVLMFDIDPVVDCAVEINDGSGWVSLSNTGVFPSHNYNIHAQQTLVADTSYTMRVTPVGKSSETVAFATLAASVGTGSMSDWPVLLSGQNPNSISSGSTPYNGKTINVTPLWSGDRTSYSKTAALTLNSAIIKDRNSIGYNTSTGASLGSAGFSSVSRASILDDKFYGISGSKIRSHEFSTGNKSDVFDFAGAGLSGTIDIGQGEGNFSYDENKVVLNDSNEVIACNIGAGTFVKRSYSQLYSDGNSVHGITPNNIDWVGYSSTGSKILANIDGYSSGHSKRWTLYDDGFTNPRTIGSNPYMRARHAAFFMGTNGEDCMAIYHWNALIIVDLNNPTVVYRIPTTVGIEHMSGIGQQPGWIVMASKDSNSIIQLVKFDVADFAGASVETSGDSHSTIGNFRWPTGTPDIRMVGRVPSTNDSGGSSYPDTAMPQPALDGSAIYASTGESPVSVVKITVS